MKSMMARSVVFLKAAVLSVLLVMCITGSISNANAAPPDRSICEGVYVNCERLCMEAISKCDSRPDLDCGMVAQCEQGCSSALTECQANGKAPFEP